jgi:hypothetical protein
MEAKKSNLGFSCDSNSMSHITNLVERRFMSSQSKKLPNVVQISARTLSSSKFMRT